MKAATRRSIFAVLATACGLCLTAWGQAAATSSATSLIPTTALVATTSLTPDGKKSILTVQNLRDSALTALVYGAKADAPISTGGTTPVGVDAYNDPAISPTAHSIPANQTGSLTVPLSVPATAVTVKAALWADGTSFGDPKYLHTLVHRRAILKEHLASAMAILAAAKEQGMALPAVIATVLAAGAKLDQGDSFDDKSFATEAEDMVTRELTAPPIRSSDGTVLTDRETLADLMRNMRMLVDRLTPYV